MREYSLPCSFLASSYSAFSDRSPKERASFSCSATSSARVVFRYSSSSLYASRLSCVSLISFAMFANPSYSVSSAFEPYSTLYYKLSTDTMSSDSTIFCPIFCRSARLSHSFHRFLKLRIGFRRQKEKFCVCSSVSFTSMSGAMPTSARLLPLGVKYSSTDRLTAEPSLSW